MSKKSPPAVCRLVERVTREPSGCWRFEGSHTPDGYATCTTEGKPRYVRRVLFEDKHGPVPVGLELDHVCRNRWCVNPDHQEPVTHLENMRRGAWARRTACKNGHPFTAANTRVVRRGNRETRICRTCRKLQNRARASSLRENAWATRRALR